MEQFRNILMTTIIIFFGVLMGTVYPEMQLFKWVDEKGTVHFTEDPTNIPEKYRDSSESRTMEEDRMTPEQRLEKRKQEEFRAPSQKDYPKSQPAEKKQVDRPRGKCEIVMVGRTENLSKGGMGETRVSIVITNNDVDEKTITESNIVGITPEKVVSRYKQRRSKNLPFNPPQLVPAEYRDRFTPKPFRIKVGAGEIYRGEIFFDRILPISKLELLGL